MLLHNLNLFHQAEMDPPTKLQYPDSVGLRIYSDNKSIEHDVVKYS